MYLKIHKKLKNKNPGMSLIEIMLVFTVIMVMMVGVFQVYKTIQSSQKKSATKNLLLQLQTGLESFKNDIGRYPSKIEEFVNGPNDSKEKRRWSSDYINRANIIDGVIKDSYGNEIVYNYDKSKNSFEIYSWGPKGVGSETDQILPD